MEVNLSFSELSRVILIERDEPLSRIEIRDMLSHHYSPELILYLIKGLNEEKINPHTLLVQSIANSQTKDDLISVGLGLRYGADPNMYVCYPTVGDIHILGYVYLALAEKDLGLLNGTVIMLMAMGADPSLPAFRSEDKCVDEYSLLQPDGKCVIDWICDQGYDTIIPQLKSGFDSVEEIFMNTLATYLDNPDLLRSEPLLDEALKAHSIKIIQQADFDSKEGLVGSVIYLNLSAYEIFTDRGFLPSYSTINDLILGYNNYIMLEDYVSAKQLKGMLLYSVSRGSILDTYQTNLINPKLMDEIMEVYCVPYWKKACNLLVGKSPDKLKQLAYQLNLNPESDKSILCNKIKKLSMSDPVMLKFSVAKRNLTRIISEVSYINEFGQCSDCEFPSIKLPPIHCNNRSLITDNMFDFPDPELAYYRDDHDKLWCFTSNLYNKMVETGINPYTKEKFPPSFLNSVKTKIELIQNYRDMDCLPVPVSETIDQLSLPDEINNNLTNFYIDKMEKQLIKRGLNKDLIELIEITKLEDILLDSFNLSVNLEPLDKTHRIVTFYIISHRNIKDDSFFEKLKQNVGNNGVLQ